MGTTQERKPPTRVVIVGGGCAGIAAAWQISQQPNYVVDVYERSWRLGGKAASVRDSKGHIHEHGLHVWLGFYENAFRMMRECYDEVREQGWGPESTHSEKLTHGSMDDAFFPEPNVGVAGLDAADGSIVWSGHLPPARGLPGDDLDEETNPFTLSNYLLRCFDLLKALMLSVIGPPDENVPGKPRPDKRSKIDEAIELNFAFDATRSPALLVERVAQLLRTGTLTTAAGLLQAVTMLERWLQQLNHAPQVADSVLELLEAVAAQTRKQLRDLVAVDKKLRWKTEIIDIVMAIAVGLYRDRVLFQNKGFDAINHIDYRKWLLEHGATKTSLDSRFITGIYDLVFAYRDGDREYPALAAGVALRGALRMFFTYRGSMFWRMRSGMGDAVFAPLYKTLLLEKQAKAKRKDGAVRKVSQVRFHFLHTLSQVSFDFKDKGARCVTQLEFKTVGDRDKVDKASANALDAFGCWPDSPAERFGNAASQTANKSGEADAGETQTTPRKLVYGGDGDDGFDAVIFATGIDDFLEVCAGGRPSAVGNRSEFYNNMPPAWAKMSQEVSTVATQAAQVWLTADLEKLGWHRGSGLVTALNFRFNTWADMTHTLATEQAWRSAKSPQAAAEEPTRSVAYFCGVLSEKEIKRQRQDIERQRGNQFNASIQSTTAKDAGADSRVETNRLLNARMEEKVRKDLTYLLRREIGQLWPALKTEKKKEKSAKNGSALRFEVDRHAQANFRGSDRYTLSLPGSIDDRISPLDRTVVNMTIAGDWTACGLDAGCIEAAVMSGMLAAHAITQEPSLESIIGFDHP